jgi:hypothetical protein
MLEVLNIKFTFLWIVKPRWARIRAKITWDKEEVMMLWQYIFNI